MSCCGSCQDKPVNHNKRWSSDDEKDLLVKFASGKPLDLIADELGRTVVSILHRLSLNELVEFDREKNAYYTVPTLLYQF